MADPITDFYADNPVEVLDKNQRTWYDPDILRLFRQRALFTPVITYARNLGDVRATNMVVTQLLDPHANYNPLAVRQLWMPAMHIDSRYVEISFSHYGGKVALHEYDDLVTYWRENGQAGLRRILNGALGAHIIDVHDMLSRNALLQGALETTGYTYYAGNATNFGDIDSLDVFTPGIAAEIQLGMKYREVAGAVNPDGSAGSVICFTSPGVTYDIQQDPDWIEIQKYANPSMLLRYEIGAYKGVRFVESPRLTLWNCGALTFQAPISAAVNAGDGAPSHASSKVDGVFRVGQTSAGVVNYIQLGAATVGAIADLAAAVNKIVTIHIARTNSFGVANGVNPFDGQLHNRRIISVDEINLRLILDKPIMIDMTTDLGGGVYGYVSYGQDVHASIFIGGSDAIVAGVARGIKLHTPPPIDDLEAIYRFSWDDRIGFQPYNPDVFEVVFSAGSTRIKGKM